MSARPCASPVDFALLADYWLGDAGAQEPALEEHLFGCGHCTARLAELARLGAGVRTAFLAGALTAVVSAPFVEKLRREGVRLREYRLRPGETLSCTIAASDDFVVSRLAADLRGVKRLDLLREIEGRPALEMHDVPFDPAAGELLVLPPAAALKKMPSHVERVRLVAVEEAGRRTIGEYTFDHRAEP
ncbi:MAG TPA: hypothetical protein VF211_10500 [Burkholderiales bacterium]